MTTTPLGQLVAAVVDRHDIPSAVADQRIFACNRCGSLPGTCDAAPCGRVIAMTKRRAARLLVLYYLRQIG